VFVLRESKRFAEKRKKLLRKDKVLRKAFVKTIKQLAIDPSHQSLRSHKVIDADGKR